MMVAEHAHGSEDLVHLAPAEDALRTLPFLAQFMTSGQQVVYSDVSRGWYG